MVAVHGKLVHFVWLPFTATLGDSYMLGSGLSSAPLTRAARVRACPSAGRSSQHGPAHSPAPTATLAATVVPQHTWEVRFTLCIERPPYLWLLLRVQLARRSFGIWVGCNFDRSAYDSVYTLSDYL